MAANHDDVSVICNIGTNDILADGEGDGLRIHITRHVNAASRGASRFGLHRLHGTGLTRTADGHFPSPIGMDFRIGTGQHRGPTVGRFSLIDVNLDDLVTESVGKTPDIRHLAHGENELCIPSTLAYGKVRRIPKTSLTVGCAEIRGKRIGVISIPRFVANSIVQFQ